MTTIKFKRSGKTLRINCTETYFMAGLSRMRQGIPYNKAFANLRAHERAKLFAYLMTPRHGIVN